MASRGHRVIACAQMLMDGKEFPADFTFSKTDDNCPTEGYCFVGLISLEDPPKHGVCISFSFRRRCPPSPSSIFDVSSHFRFEKLLVRFVRRASR